MKVEFRTSNGFYFVVSGDAIDINAISNRLSEVIQAQLSEEEINVDFEIYKDGLLFTKQSVNIRHNDVGVVFGQVTNTMQAQAAK